MIDFVKVGLKITKYRKENNFTQDDLADKLYVSRQLVSKWENGTGVPSIDTILDMCKLFQITFEELLCLEEETSEDIFKGRNRAYVVQNIISGRIEVDLLEVFYMFSPIERMVILKKIKDKSLKCNIEELYPKLTIAEQRFLKEEEN